MLLIDQTFSEEGPLPRLRSVLVPAFCLLGLLAVAAGTLAAGSNVPPSADITGISGHAGEWELTATLTRSGKSRELSGPLKMTHIGWCSPGGPQEKSGELRVRMARISSTIEAHLRVDGMECTYAGRLSDAYTGLMACPDRRPVPLLLWLR